MSASTKLSNSVKALCFLAKYQKEPQNSTIISEHTGINASKVRMLLSALGKAGIVKTIQGSSGGFVLEKDPGEIDLQEIYCALEDRKAFHLDVTTNPDNAVEETSKINGYFQGLFADIQVEIEDKMKKIKLDHILNFAQNGEGI